MATPTKMNTVELREALHAHFIRPEDRISSAGAGAVYLTEVTAPNSSRRADAVHIGMWASRGGGRIDVCELKVSRADFRRELDKPEKAEAWWPYCNAFWIVAPSVEVAPPEELPPGWGLMVPNPRGTRRFKVIVKPAEREATITAPLLCTLLTSTETTKVHALNQQRNELYQQHQRQIEVIRRDRTGLSSKDRKRLEALDKLEERLGLELDDYPWDAQIGPEAAGDALREYMQGQAAMAHASRNAQYCIQELDRAAKGAQEQADRLRKVMGSGT